MLLPNGCSNGETIKEGELVLSIDNLPNFSFDFITFVRELEVPSLHLVLLPEDIMHTKVKRKRQDETHLFQTITNKHQHISVQIASRT